MSASPTPAPASDLRTRSLSEAIWWAALPGSVLFCVLQVTEHVAKGAIGFDSHAYWLAARMPDSLYLLAPRLKDAYLYSPAFAELLAVGAGAVARVPGAVGRDRCGAPFLALEAPRMAQGSDDRPVFHDRADARERVHPVRDSPGAWAHRFPGAFAIFAITKLAPSIVFVWFVVRREWGKAAVAIGTTLAMSPFSAAIDPEAWLHWVRFLFTSTSDGSVGAPIRAILALVIVVFAARTDRAWLLAPAVLLACPVFGGWGPLAVLAALLASPGERWSGRGALPSRAQGEAPVTHSDLPQCDTSRARTDRSRRATGWRDDRSLDRIAQFRRLLRTAGPRRLRHGFPRLLGGTTDLQPLRRHAREPGRLPLLAGVSPGSRPFAGLSWAVFAWTWAVVEMLGLWWLTRPLAWRWRIPVLLLCFNEVQVGNVYTLMAIGLAVGFRFTSAWSVIPLTKVAPTLPLYAWLVARREWSRLASSCAWLMVIVALSVFVDPELWQAWLGTLSEHAGGRLDFYVRLAMSIALALLAARRKRDTGS